MNAALSPKWEDILIVGDMFNMEEACRVATYALDHNGGLPDIRKVSLCVRHDVDRNWAIEAIKRLCARRVALTREEARDIGLDMAIAIASAREAAYNASGGKVSFTVMFDVRLMILDVDLCRRLYPRRNRAEGDRRSLRYKA